MNLPVVDWDLARSGHKQQGLHPNVNSSLHTAMVIIKLSAPLGNYANDAPPTAHIPQNIRLKVM